MNIKIILILNQFLHREYIYNYINYIIGLIISFGFIMFYESKNRMERFIDNEKQNEIQNKKKKIINKRSFTKRENNIHSS